MFKDVTFGQYYPIDSAVHRMDPRFKLVITFAFIIALFMINSWAGYIAAALFVVAVVAFANVPIKLLLKNIKPLWFILLFMLVINVCFTRTGNILFEFWIVKITDEGIVRAVQMLLRIVLLICFTGLLTLTTQPVALTVGIESLLSPLKKLKFPVHDFAMMMTIALRFIPTLMEETDKIMKAQMARGASFDTGNLYQKAKSMIPLLIPLFVSAFRRADELALAMSARCYNGGEGRTRMNQLKIGGVDYAGAAFTVLAVAIMLMFNYVRLF